MYVVAIRHHQGAEDDHAYSLVRRSTLCSMRREELVVVPHTASGGGASLVVLKEYWSTLMGCLAVIFVAEAALAHRNSFAR